VLLSEIFGFLGLRALWGFIQWGFTKLKGAIFALLKLGKSPPPNTPRPLTRAAAINRLQTLAQGGRHWMRNFSADMPTRDQVNIWWLEVMKIAELPVLEQIVTPGDLDLLKMPSAQNFEKLLEDKPSIALAYPDRIEAYHTLNDRRERLELLIGKINSL